MLFTTQYLLNETAIPEGNSFVAPNLKHMVLKEVVISKKNSFFALTFRFF
jgi:hypothetical protein